MKKTYWIGLTLLSAISILLLRRVALAECINYPPPDTIDDLEEESR